MTFISLEFNFGNTIPRLFTAKNHGFHKQRSSTEGCCDELGPGKAWESAGHEAAGWGQGGDGYQCLLLLYRPVCKSNDYSHYLGIAVDSRYC